MKDAPNVLLIVTDSTRADYVGAYNPDTRARTNSLNALAKQALRFEYAVPEAMPTGLVRRTLLTGMRGFPNRDWVLSPPMPAEVGWTRILPHQPILTEVLGNAGVETAYVTDNPFLVGPRYIGFRRTLDIARPDFSQGAYRAMNTPFRRPAPRSAIEKYLLPALSDTIEVRRLQDHIGWASLYRVGETQLLGRARHAQRHGGARGAEGQAAVLPRRRLVRPARAVRRAAAVRAT